MQAISEQVTHLQDNMWYALLITVLALLSVAMLAYEFTPNGRPDLIALMQQLDILIASVFLIDFFAGLLFNARYNWRTYVRHNWLNLISSIPVTSDMTRLLRLLRIIRAVRVIRAGINLWFAHR